MCDYSLHTFSNRLAVEGEDLVVHRFGGASLGLASCADLFALQTAKGRAAKSTSFWERVKIWFDGQRSTWEAERRVPAVCVPPGASLILRDIPKSLQRDLGVSDAEPVKFVEISAEVNTYRDAVRFKNGCQVLLQALREGQRATILSLALQPEESILMDGRFAN